MITKKALARCGFILALISMYYLLQKIRHSFPPDQRHKLFFTRNIRPLCSKKSISPRTVASLKMSKKRRANHQSNGRTARV